MDYKLGKLIIPVSFLIDTKVYQIVRINESYGHLSSPLEDSWIEIEFIKKESE